MTRCFPSNILIHTVSHLIFKIQIKFMINNLIKCSIDQRDQKTGLEQLLDHHHVRTIHSLVCLILCQIFCLCYLLKADNEKTGQLGELS